MNVGHSTAPLSNDRRVSASFHIFTVNLSHRWTAQWPNRLNGTLFVHWISTIRPIDGLPSTYPQPLCYLPTSELSFLLEDGPPPDFFFSFLNIHLGWKSRWWKSFKARIVRRSSEIWRAPCVQRPSATLSPSDYDSFDRARPLQPLVVVGPPPLWSLFRFLLSLSPSILPSG